MLQLTAKNWVVIVCGCSGSGKSTFIVCYLNNAKLTCRFIFDASGEYAQRFGRRACQTVAELNAAIVTGWVIFDPHILFPGEPEKAFANFCEWAWTVSKKLPGRKVVFADEVWKVCDPYKLPKPLALICQDGRKNGVGLIASTQRPNRLNESLMGEATQFVGFRMKGDNMLDYLRRNTSDFPVDDLPGLPDLHYIAQNTVSGGLRRGKVRF